MILTGDFLWWWLFLLTNQTPGRVTREVLSVFLRACNTWIHLPTRVRACDCFRHILCVLGEFTKSPGRWQPRPPAQQSLQFHCTDAQEEMERWKQPGWEGKQTRLPRTRRFKHLLGHVVGKSCLRRKSKFGKTPLGESGERDGAPGGR